MINVLLSLKELGIKAADWAFMLCVFKNPLTDFCDFLMHHHEQQAKHKEINNSKLKFYNSHPAVLFPAFLISCFSPAYAYRTGTIWFALEESLPHQKRTLALFTFSQYGFM